MRIVDRELILELVGCMSELHEAYDGARAQQHGGELLTRSWDLMKKAEKQCES